MFSPKNTQSCSTLTVLLNFASPRMEDDDDCIDVNIDIGEEEEEEEHGSQCNEDARDLQLEVNSFCMYLGGLGDPPTLEQQRYGKGCKLISS